MNSTIQEYKDTEKLIAAFDAKCKEGGMFIVYLTGGVSEETGKSWCPDCDVARPNVASLVLEKTTLTVLKGVVDDRDSWVGVATHPYKQHPIIAAGGVPSLLLIEDGEVRVRAESEEDFENEDLMVLVSCLD